MIEQLNQLEAHAKSRGNSLAEWINGARKILRDRGPGGDDRENGKNRTLDQEEERSRLTREALDDVDAGSVIDHQAVQAWAESLTREDRWTVELEQTNDGSGDAILNIPDDLMRLTGLKIGDELGISREGDVISLHLPNR